MITTIQIRETVKNELDKLKMNKETYEEVILNLMKIAEQYQRRKKQLLIEGCKKMADDSLRITKEWENTDNQIDWKW